MLTNKLPIKVTSRRVSNCMVLDVTIGARDSFTLTVPEVIDLIRRLESQL